MDDDDDVELFMLDDMQSSGIEVLIIDELEIIELSMDELVGQAIEELDVELSIMLDEDASAAKPGTTWAAIPPDASSRATMARYFFNFISSWLNVASTSTQRERSHVRLNLIGQAVGPRCG